MSQVHNSTTHPREQLEEWILALFEAVITCGKVEPQRVLLERARELLATLRWPEIRAWCREWLAVDPTPIERLAADYPNLPELLKTEQGIKAILDYPKQHPREMADFHQKLIELNDLTLSISMGQLRDGREIWAQFRRIVTGTEEGGDGEK